MSNSTPPSPSGAVFNSLSVMDIENRAYAPPVDRLDSQHTYDISSSSGTDDDDDDFDLELGPDSYNSEDEDGNNNDDMKLAPGDFHYSIDGEDQYNGSIDYDGSAGGGMYLNSATPVNNNVPTYNSKGKFKEYTSRKDSLLQIAADAGIMPHEPNGRNRGSKKHLYIAGLYILLAVTVVVAVFLGTSSHSKDYGNVNPPVASSQASQEEELGVTASASPSESDEEYFKEIMAIGEKWEEEHQHQTSTKVESSVEDTKISASSTNEDDKEDFNEIMTLGEQWEEEHQHQASTSSKVESTAEDTKASTSTDEDDKEDLTEIMALGEQWEEEHQQHQSSTSPKVDSGNDESFIHHEDTPPSADDSSEDTSPKVESTGEDTFIQHEIPPSSDDSKPNAIASSDDQDNFQHIMELGEQWEQEHQHQASEESAAHHEDIPPSTDESNVSASPDVGSVDEDDFQHIIELGQQWEQDHLHQGEPQHQASHIVDSDDESDHFKEVIALGEQWEAEHHMGTGTSPSVVHHEDTPPSTDESIHHEDTPPSTDESNSSASPSNVGSDDEDTEVSESTNKGDESDHFNEIMALGEQWEQEHQHQTSTNVESSDEDTKVSTSINEDEEKEHFNEIMELGEQWEQEHQHQASTNAESSDEDNKVSASASTSTNANDKEDLNEIIALGEQWEQEHQAGHDTPPSVDSNFVASSPEIGNDDEETVSPAPILALSGDQSENTDNTLRIKPTAISTINSIDPASTTGGEMLISVSDSGVSSISFLRFGLSSDITNADTSSKVSKATLHLHLTTPNEDIENDATVTIEVLPNAGDWNDHLISWDNPVDTNGSVFVTTFEILNTEEVDTSSLVLDVTQALAHSSADSVTLKLSTSAHETIEFASYDWEKGTMMPELVLTLSE